VNDIYDRVLSKILDKAEINTVENEQLLIFNVFDRRRSKGIR